MYSWISFKKISQSKEKTGIFTNSMLDNSREKAVQYIVKYFQQQQQDITLSLTRSLAIWRLSYHEKNGEKVPATGPLQSIRNDHLTKYIKK